MSCCIDCCIPPNWLYMRSLTFSRESLTWKRHNSCKYKHYHIIRSRTRWVYSQFVSLTSRMYLISSWRWLVLHSRAITSCCLSEPVLCTTPYTLGPWCCSEGSGTPLAPSARCWGRQDHSAQVSADTSANTRRVFVGLVFCGLSGQTAMVFEVDLFFNVWTQMPALVYLTYFKALLLSLGNWKMGARGGKKAQGVLKVSHFCNPVPALLLFLAIVPLTRGRPN